MLRMNLGPKDSHKFFKIQILKKKNQKNKKNTHKTFQHQLALNRMTSC